MVYKPACHSPLLCCLCCLPSQCCVDLVAPSGLVVRLLCSLRFRWSCVQLVFVWMALHATSCLLPSWPTPSLHTNMASSTHTCPSHQPVQPRTPPPHSHPQLQQIMMSGSQLACAFAGSLLGWQLGNPSHDDVQAPRRSATICHCPSVHLWSSSHLLRRGLLCSLCS